MLERLDFLAATRDSENYRAFTSGCIRIQAQAGNKGANCHHQAASLSS